MTQSHFEILLRRNVPHILENILFSLDYESFKACFEVSSTWHNLLKSETLIKKAKSLFHDEILYDDQKLYSASFEGSLDRVRKLTFYGLVNLNYVYWICPFSGQEQSTPLFVAALNGHLEVEQLLLERGAIPDQMYKELNQEKLWKAAKEGRIEEVTRLLSCEGLDKD